jgi:hypothetical protein
MSKRSRLVAVVTAALLALPATALGASNQMGAGDDPTLKGPLSTRDSLQGCKKEKEKYQGELVANFHICNGYYVFDPEAETDGTYDYGAYWVQGTVNTVNGWCTTKIDTDLDPAGEGVLSRAPKPGTKLSPNRSKRYTTKLTVDAQGAAETKGVIKNTFRVLPGKMRTIAAGGGILRIRWTGKTGKKLAFAMGLELRWPTGESPPEVSPSMSAVFRKAGC